MFLCIKKPSFYDSLDLEIGISRAPKEVEGISFLPSLSFSRFPLQLFLFLLFFLSSFSFRANVILVFVSLLFKLGRS